MKNTMNTPKPSQAGMLEQLRKKFDYAYTTRGRGSVAKTLQYGWRRLHKKAHHLLHNHRNRSKNVLWIIGCQRSGTSLMLHIFDRDLDCRVFPESNPKLFEGPRGHKRAQSLSTVKHVILQEPAPFVVIKPLMETQNAVQWLDYFEGSRALWVYRHYLDVAHSNLARFGMGNGVKNLRSIVEQKAGNWRSECVSDEVRTTVTRFFAEDMEPYDAAALFWYARNSLFFDLGLDRHTAVRMVKYEELVAEPVSLLQGVYSFLGRSFPGRQLTEEVHRESLGKGGSILISPAIDQLCQGMLARLDQCYLTRRAA